MGVILRGYVVCLCILVLRADRHWGHGDNGHYNGGDNGNGHDNDDRDEERCRCATYCSLDEYYVGACNSWWRKNYCCQYEICGKCHCADTCGSSEVFKGYCDNWKRKCCPKCQNNS